MVAEPVVLHGLGDAQVGPTILERTDQEFIPAILGELAGPDGPRVVAGSQANRRDADGVRKLLQPVQRTFNVALFEVACDTVGQPRLDRRRIDSAGLVLRRVSVDGRGRPLSGRLEGWRRADQSLRGWVPFPNQPDQDQDPDPARRPAALSAGHPEIDRRLALLRPPAEPLAETVSPLFIAPPEVCEAANRTILYGLVPVTSSEISESPDQSSQASREATEEIQARLKAHLHRYLKAGGPYTVPRAKQTLTSSAADDPGLDDFLVLLRQLAIELDAFGETPEARALFAALNGIRLTFSTTPAVTRPAGDFLRDAARVLVERTGATIGMPIDWPAIDQVQGERILRAVQAALTAQREIVKPREGRFDDLTRRYRVRAFVRVKRSDGCPPDTIWSDYSEPFTIAPWYESGDAPPVQVALPDLTNREVLKRLKPNVAFAVPESLQNILTQNSPRDFLGGSGKPGSGSMGLDWICGFSIPIITLCAFIVLNIFLQLFDIIFRWLLFVKVCIPFPRRG